MIIDGQLFFSGTASTGQAITVTADSTNILDIGPNARDIGVLDYPSPLLVVQCLTSFTSSTATATLTIELQGAPDNAGVAGTFQTIDKTPAIPLGQLGIGNRPYKQGITILSEMPLPIVNTTMTTTATSTSATVTGTAVVNGMQVINPNVVPGTIVSTGGGTTSLVLSTAAAISATLAATTFRGPLVLPRFLKLVYTASATMTAGSVWAGIVLDTDKPTLYAPGFVFPAGA